MEERSSVAKKGTIQAAPWATDLRNEIMAAGGRQAEVVRAFTYVRKKKAASSM